MAGTGRRAGRGSLPLALVATLAVCAGGGCNPSRVNVDARKLVPIAPGEIRRIAVMPFTAAALETAAPQPGQEPLVESPADTVTRAMSEALRRYPDFRIVDPSIVADTFERMYGEVRAPTAEEAVAVGKRLAAIDAVLRGEVSQFVERVGTEVAAKEPARVAFAVELVRIPSGERVWQAEYAETQRALSENLWNLAGFFRAGAKWVRAGELAEIGAENVAARLHEALTGSTAPPPRPPRHTPR